MKSAFFKYYHRLIPIVLGLVALAIPLLCDFHIESALLAAFAGCFWAGWKASENRSKGGDISAAISILGYLYLFGMPLLVYALLTGCFSLHGLGFWILYPVPSVFFGLATGRLARIRDIPKGSFLTIMVLLSVAFGSLIIEFYSFPQVYFYNHVWGGWPGPIYDETVQVTMSLIYFRLLTLFWIVLLWNIPNITKTNYAKWMVLSSVLAMALCYTKLPELGIITPTSYLQEQLGGMRQTPHFTLYYDKNYFTEDEINLLAKEHEFYFQQISINLELSTYPSDRKIESYLYAHPWQKKELVGAKFTSYVPVWLEQDQLHIAKQQLDGSLKHEMVHVLAKQFGNDWINASWSIGLIEGLAVAVAPDESDKSTIDQIVISEKPLPGADEMEHALSPLGFYGGRSTVNYTTTGSFVQYLLKNYPVANMKEAYRSGSISKAYRVSFEKLVKEWHGHLNTVSIDSVDRRIARRLFSIPSLFEKDCPHILSDFAVHWDNYRYHLAERDTASAMGSLDDAFNLKPENLFIKTEWTFGNLKQGNAGQVQVVATLKDTLVDLQLLYADAFMLTGNYAEAKNYLNRGAELFKDDPGTDSLSKAAIQTRQDSLQWEYYLDLRYKNKLFDKNVFQDLLYRTQVLAIEQVIENEQWLKLSTYSRLLYKLPADNGYFDSYLNIVHLLGNLQQWDLADNWLAKLDALQKRQRYIERLQQESSWVTFLKQSDINEKL